jgi:hypothetical protein
LNDDWPRSGSNKKAILKGRKAVKTILMAVVMATTVFLGSCASPTESKPTIPLSISGGGAVTVGTRVSLVANATYSGSGTLTYKWYVEGQLQAGNTKDLGLSANAAMTLQVKAEVTDGTLTGTATTSATWQ